MPFEARYCPGEYEWECLLSRLDGCWEPSNSTFHEPLCYTGRPCQWRILPVLCTSLISPIQRCNYLMDFESLCCASSFQIWYNLESAMPCAFCWQGRRISAVSWKYWCRRYSRADVLFSGSYGRSPQSNPRLRDGPSREGAYSMALRLNVCGYGTYLCAEIAIWEELGVSTLVAYNDVKCRIGIPTCIVYVAGLSTCVGKHRMLRSMYRDERSKVNAEIKQQWTNITMRKWLIEWPIKFSRWSVDGL